MQRRERTTRLTILSVSKLLDVHPLIYNNNNWNQHPTSKDPVFWLTGGASSVGLFAEGRKEKKRQKMILTYE